MQNWIWMNERPESQEDNEKGGKESRGNTYTKRMQNDDEAENGIFS